MKNEERTLVLVVCHPCLNALHKLRCKTRETTLSAFKSSVIQLFFWGVGVAEIELENRNRSSNYRTTKT